MAANEQDFSDWGGKTEVSYDIIDPALAERLRTTLLRIEQTPATGVLPTLGHWCYFQSPAPADLLGEDGHPQRGGFLPPIALPRRMWAGGSLEFLSPIPIGATLSRHSTIGSIQAKEGRRGKLVFVSITHDYWQEETKLITERQDLVFREAAIKGNTASAKSKTTTLPLSEETPTPLHSQTLRGDALTFNSHRIHYDRDYAIQVEGYSGLVVHGPLLATQLAQFAEQRFANDGRSLRHFDFKAVSPVIDTQHYTLCAGSEADDGCVPLWIVKDDGVVAMRAEARFL